MTAAIAELKRLAESQGGNYLGLSPIKHAHRKHVWKCNKGHTWEARADSVLRGSWCPLCRKIQQENIIKEMRRLAIQKGGECLSPVYIDHRTRLKWKCEFGHIWLADLHSVKSGSWCPVCGHQKSGRRPLSIEEMRKFAALHGGKCLSENYINSDTKLKWMCKNGLVWMALPLSVKKGYWCAECTGQKKLTLEQMQRVAKERGGRCLSTEYKASNRKLQWQCAEGHTWFAAYNNISIGGRCPECSSGVGERICRTYFKQIFGKKFAKTRPPWLIKKDGFQMELDGYCEELNLAFEHQGRQHYEQIDHFYTSEEQFLKRKADDKRKVYLCEKHNITLIRVLQIPDSLHVSKVQTYIINQCKKSGVEIPEGAENIRVKLLKAYTPTAREKMKQVCEAAENRGGICLSTTYAGNQVKLRFRCEYGHEWETIPMFF